MQLILTLFLALYASPIEAFLTPLPSGKYNVTLSLGALTDYSRNDPFAATPTPREVVLSVFQPANCQATTTAPYMDNITAEVQGQVIQQIFNVSADFTPIFLEARLPVCSLEATSECGICESKGILLFSPGLNIPRLFYSVLAQSIASEGFIVITIDHPGDADIIVYPDGHIVYANKSISLANNTVLDVDTRAGDMSFIIDQLSNATAIGELLPRRGQRAFCTGNVAVFGHSLGGATSVIAASQDNRIRGAINWDGTIYGLPQDRTVSKPILFLEHDQYPLDPTWVAAYSQITGPKAIELIKNTTHETFSDVPTLLEAIGQDATPYADLIGTIAPTKFVSILTAYTTAWMEGVFAGKIGGSLLEGNGTKFPEVVLIEKDNF